MARDEFLPNGSTIRKYLEEIVIAVHSATSSKRTWATIALRDHSAKFFILGLISNSAPPLGLVSFFDVICDTRCLFNRPMVPVECNPSESKESVVSPRKILWGIVLGAITFVGSTAHARSVDLTCREDNSSQDSRVGHITFDQRQGTAGFAITGEMPMSPADFTDKQITWNTKYAVGRVYFILDRATGALQMSGATTGKWHCSR